MEIDYDLVMIGNDEATKVGNYKLQFGEGSLNEGKT